MSHVKCANCSKYIEKEDSIIIENLCSKYTTPYVRVCKACYGILNTRSNSTKTFYKELQNEMTK